MKVPLGCTLEEVVAQAGGTTVKDPVYFRRRPRWGRIGNGSDPVTKTTNAILVLPKDHVIVMKKQRTSSILEKHAYEIVKLSIWLWSRWSCIRNQKSVFRHSGHCSSTLKNFHKYEDSSSRWNCIRWAMKLC